MRRSPSRDPAAHLRDEIRRAGIVTGEARWLLQLAVGSFLIGIAFFACLIGLISVMKVSQQMVLIVGLAPFLLLVVGMPCWYLGTWVVMPLPAAYRELRLTGLRRRLARVPRAHLAEILLPLRQERIPDVRRIVEPLIRELRPQGSELSPAPPPVHTGAELLPAED